MSEQASVFYPFLVTGSQDLAADLEASTVMKTREVARLRGEVAAADADRLAACALACASAFRDGGRLFAFGNGGSVTDAQEVARVFVEPPYGLRLPAVALTNPAVVTALTNDVGFDVVYARQLDALARPGDIAVGLSTSGGSANVNRAFDQARRLEMVTVGLAGSSGGLMAEPGRVEHLFVVPSDSVHRIQEVQTTIYHALWELVQQVL